jgi:RNA polymerase sigma factor (sigma-70 family)
VKQSILTHDQLDERLNRLEEPEADYNAGLHVLVEEVDDLGIPLEIRSSESWRTSSTPRPLARVASIEEQFRTEVDRICRQEREAESRLARRMEFARFRYERALAKADIDPHDLAGRLPSAPSEGQAFKNFEPGFPLEVLLRWQELHALRVELVERNLYLVLINVERYAHTRTNRMDLIQEGSSVLFRAADGFEWRRGLLFRTYAVHWLNQAFRSYLYNFGNTVRVPVYLQKAMKHVRDAKERLGNEPQSVKAIATEADLGEKIVQSALGASRSTQSIDVSLGSVDDEGMSLSEILSTGEEGLYRSSMEDVSVTDGVRMALDRLGARERHVIDLRFGLTSGREHTLAEIAKDLGVSLERVRQIQVRAISKMNTPLLRKAIDPHLV